VINNDQSSLEAILTYTSYRSPLMHNLIKLFKKK